MPQLNYNKCISKTVTGEKINYGIVLGNEKIVFIKTGADGNILGYQNKYPRMAHRIHQRLGATVICASNPDVEHQLQQVPDIRMISQVATDCGFTDYSVYLIGISDGAYNNLLLAQAVPQVRKLLNINTSPKMRNNKSDLQDLGNRLQQLASIHKTLVYGTEDEEYCHVPHLKALGCDRLEILAVEGADHVFTGMVEDFIALTDLL